MSNVDSGVYIRQCSAAAGVFGGGGGAMRARGHGGAEMAKVGCRVDARARSRLARTEKGKGREMASDAHCARVWCMIAVWHAWLEG